MKMLCCFCCVTVLSLNKFNLHVQRSSKLSKREEAAELEQSAAAAHSSEGRPSADGGTPATDAYSVAPMKSGGGRPARRAETLPESRQDEVHLDWTLGSTNENPSCFSFHAS